MKHIIHLYPSNMSNQNLQDVNATNDLSCRYERDIIKGFNAIIDSNIKITNSLDFWMGRINMNTPLTESLLPYEYKNFAQSEKFLIPITDDFVNNYIIAGNNARDLRIILDKHNFRYYTGPISDPTILKYFNKAVQSEYILVSPNLLKTLIVMFNGNGIEYFRNIEQALICQALYIKYKQDDSIQTRCDEAEFINNNYKTVRFNDEERNRIISCEFTSDEIRSLENLHKDPFIILMFIQEQFPPKHYTHRFIYCIFTTTAVDKFIENFQERYECTPKILYLWKNTTDASLSAIVNIKKYLYDQRMLVQHVCKSKKNNVIPFTTSPENNIDKTIKQLHKILMIGKY